MLEICSVREAQMPRLYESAAPVGTLTAETAALLGLPQTVIVCAGAGDNAAAGRPLPQEPFRLFLFHRLPSALTAAVCPAFATVKRRRDPRRERETVRPYWKDCQEKKNTAGSRSSLGRRHGSPQTAGLIRKRRLEGLIAARLLSGISSGSFLSGGKPLRRADRSDWPLKRFSALCKTESYPVFASPQHTHLRRFGLTLSPEYAITGSDSRIGERRQGARTTNPPQKSAERKLTK